MTEEQPQIRINPEEIEVEAKAKKAAAAAAATAGAGGVGMFDDLEAAAAAARDDEGKDADAEAADNSQRSTKRCNRRLGIFGTSFLLFVAALIGGGFGLQRSRNQISAAMMESAAPDCQDGDEPIRRLSKGDKCEQSKCTSEHAGLLIKDEYVEKALEEWKIQAKKHTSLALAAVTDAYLGQFVLSAVKAADKNADRTITIHHMLHVLTSKNFKGLKFLPLGVDFALKVDKPVKKFVKELNQHQQRTVDIEIDKNAVTVVEGAVENYAAMVSMQAFKLAKGIVGAKHIVRATKEVTPKSIRPGIKAAVLNTIFSCACEGKFKIGRLAKLLKFLGNHVYNFPSFEVVQPDAIVAFRTIPEGVATAVLRRSIEYVRGCGSFVIGKNDIVTAIAEDTALNTYFKGIRPGTWTLPNDLARVQAAGVAKRLDSSISLTADASGYVNELCGEAFYRTVDKGFRYAVKDNLAEINLNLVTRVLSDDTPKVIRKEASPLILRALKSLLKCQKDLEIVDEDGVNLTDEFLLGEFDFVDDGEDPED